jgi:hypothetical protein
VAHGVVEESGGYLGSLLRIAAGRELLGDLHFEVTPIS